MDSEQRVLEVDGETIRTGTSLFNTETEKVLWYTGIRNGMVQLDTVSESIEMSEGVFRTHITTGNVIVEAQATGYSE